MYAARLGRGAGATTVVGVDVGADAEDLPVVDGEIIIHSGGLGSRGGGGRGEHGAAATGQVAKGLAGAMVPISMPVEQQLLKLMSGVRQTGRYCTNSHSRPAGGVQKGVIAKSRIKGGKKIGVSYRYMHSQLLRTN